MTMLKTTLACGIALGLLVGCATESSRSLEVAKVASYNTQYNGVIVKSGVWHSGRFLC